MYTVILALLGCTSYGRVLPAIVLTQVSEEAGLSDNQVQCLLKNKAGQLWIGTADGLNLLDGSTVKIFRHSDGDSTSLLNNSIESLAEDKNGNTWIATVLGVACYQKQQKRFFNLSLPFSPYGASNIVRTVIADAEDNIWCITDGGLFRYETKTSIISSFYNTMPGETSSKTNKYAGGLPDGDIIWLASYDGLWMFDKHNSRFQRASSPTNDASYEGLVNTVYKDHANRLWFGNWSKGLKQYDRKTGTVHSYGTLPGAATKVVAINELVLNNGEQLLIINGSLQCFDPATNSFLQLPKPVQLPDYPVANNFYRSADGWLWIGTAQGLYMYNPNRQFFQHHLFPKPISTQPLSFAEWGNDLLVGGQAGNFLARYDAQGNPVHTYPAILQKTTVNDADHHAESALCIVKEPGGNLLITTSGGILRYHTLSGKRSWFMHNGQDTTTLPKNFIQHLFIDSKNRYWVFPWREGIYRMDSTSGKVTLQCKGIGQQGSALKGLVIADAAEDENGNIWMADLDEGIILFDQASHHFSKPFKDQLGDRVHSSRIIYRNGYCYAFANEWLLKWNTKSRALQLFRLPAAAATTIYDLLIDAAGTWWMATKKGLVAFTDRTNTIQQFTTADGLLNNNMDGNLYQAKNGNILFGTPEYITQFKPRLLLNSAPVNFNITVTGIEVNGADILYDGRQKLDFDPAQNNIIFRWAISDFTNPFHNQYYCKLQGIDADWKYAGNKGEIQYANLSPGKYTLLLKAATANGQASANMITLNFKINPPFWKAIWFWLPLIGTSLFLIGWLVNKRIKNIRNKAAIRQQITELELKALRAQMNPHFIFNSLSSIQDSILQNKTEAASKYLGKFSKLIRVLLENSGKKWITLQDELEYLQLYLELESFRFDDLEFNIDCRVSDPLFIRLPPMIVQPYIENALKHGLAHKTGIKKLRIIIYQNANAKLVAEVLDNGIGRRESAAINARRTASHQSMGMRLTEQRLQLLSNQERQIEITDLVNENKAPLGTKITIILPVEQ